MPAYSQSTIRTRAPSWIRLAGSRSLWHGTGACSGPCSAASIRTASACARERDGLRGDAGRGSRLGRRALSEPVDAEHLGVRAGQPHDEIADAHVAVGDAALERDHGLAAQPEVAEHVVEEHSRRFPAMARTVKELEAQVSDGTVDTVLIGITDMQGRLQGKRMAAT